MCCEVIRLFPDARRRVFSPFLGQIWKFGCVYLACCDDDWLEKSNFFFLFASQAMNTDRGHRARLAAMMSHTAREFRNVERISAICARSLIFPVHQAIEPNLKPSLSAAKEITKRTFRLETWQKIKEQKLSPVRRFNSFGMFNKIPYLVGVDKAAELLAETDEFKKASE